MASLMSTFGSDPVPWITDLWSDALDGRRSDVERSRAALAALSTLAGGLTDDDSTYSVRFGTDGLTTNTSIGGKVVTIGHAPLADKALTNGQRAAIMTGLMFHEVGHIRHTRKVEHVLDSYGVKGDVAWKRAQRVLNLADDVRSERLNCVEFPGLAETLPITLRWVGERTIKPGFKARQITTAFGLGIMAVRYPDFCDWSGRETARDWWQSWADRAAVAHTIPALRAVMDEALDRIGSNMDMQDDEPDEPTTEGGEQGEPTDGESTEGGSDADGDDATEGGEGDDSDGGDGESDDATEGGEQGEPGDGTDGGDATEGGEDGDGGSDDPWQEQDEPTEGGNEPGAAGGDHPGQASEPTEGGDDDDEGEPIDVEDVMGDCPMDKAGTDGTEGDVQQALDLKADMTRQSMGKRTYELDNPWTPGAKLTYEVTRAVPARRGRGTTGGGGMAFLPPTVGIRMAPSTVSGQGTVRPTLRVGVSQALAGAIAASRRGDPAPTPGQRSGRLDRQRLARVASGDCRVFTNVVTPGPTRIRAIVLLDASGSMTWRGLDGRTGPTRATIAAQVGMDLAGAFARMPHVTAAVYAHNENHGCTIHALWQTGEPTDYVGDYADLRLDSNEDALAIRYCVDDITESRKAGEACVLVVVSDGKPASTAMVKASVDDARKRGVAVVSVAIAPEANDAQVMMYGHDDVIPFEPQPLVMARKIAQAIGRRI